MKGLGYPLYVNGKLFQEPVTISHVPADAVGCVGAGYPPGTKCAPSGLGADRDPSMGGLGRVSGLGQYVQYYPNFPSMGADDAAAQSAEAPRINPIAAMLGVAFMGAGVYHGYKRNESVGWALGWGFLTAAFPIIMIPIAIAQGFGKPKTMRSNSSRRRRRRKASARRRTARAPARRRRTRRKS